MPSLPRPVMSRHFSLIVIGSVLMLAGCQSPGPVSAPPEQTTAQETAENASRAHRSSAATGRLIDIPRLQGQLETAGPGLQRQLNVDPQSLQSLRDQLRAIASETSAEQYRQLDISLDVIWRFGGFASSFDTENFLGHLDGKTGNDIIREATEIIRRREEARPRR